MTEKRTARKEPAKRAAKARLPATTIDVSRQLDAIVAAHKAGVLTEKEFDAKRAPLVNALHELADAEVRALSAGGMPLGVSINTPLVVAGELIESAWGNQVRTDLFSLNSGKVEKTGDSITGSLTLSGGSTQIVLPNDPTSSTHAARKNYVDTTTVSLTGDDMSGNLQVGGDPATTQGSSLRTSGQLLMSIAAPAAAASANLFLVRAGTPTADVGSRFAVFNRSASGVGGAIEIGSITVATGSTVAYNTSSDPRAKVYTAPAYDAADIVQTLGAQAYRGRWRDPDTNAPIGGEWVLLNSTDVEAVAPYAVSGVADAVDENGRPEYQQVNWQGLVPLLTAALSQALDRIEALEARR